jgi:hypothetical protein
MTAVYEYVELETPAWLVTSPMGDDVPWRWTRATAEALKYIDAIPSITGISFTPATISLGENLGQRATLSITFKDHRHIFASEPWDQGTFWGKWRGRYGQRLRGRNLRWIRGTDGQALADMETWHFVVESVSGPTPDGQYTITAQDVLKLADDERALAPRPSRGSLIAGISNVETTASLTPAGIGNIDYAAITNVVSGYVNIGGKEVCQCTRVGDVLTLTRNTTIPGTAFETEVSAHDAGTRVQLCLPYIGESVADIVSDLFETYAGVDEDYIDLFDEWYVEQDTYLQTLYTAIVTEPTGVNKLVSELVQQAGLAIWWDATTQKLRLLVLRAIPTVAAIYNEENTLAGGLKTQEQPAKRISEVLFYYGMRNPLKPIDQADNYRAAVLTPDLEAAADYGGVVNKTIKSRWVPFGAEQVASRVSYILLGRFRDPPRRITFDTWRFGETTPALGGGYQLAWTENQDSDGNAALAPIQVTRLAPGPEKYSVEAEEMLWTFYEDAGGGGGLQDRVIVINANVNNVNLRDMHDSIYPQVTDDDVSASPPVTLTVLINLGVIVGSANTGNPAFDVGDWPIGFQITIANSGRIQGAGGNGGDQSSPGPGQGYPGGTALYTRHNVTVDNDGEIWGGGGGGGISGVIIGQFARGGGGAGTVPGQAPSQPSGTPPANGTSEAGGSGGSVGSLDGGDGGDPGQAGETGEAGKTGGAAGNAIDGDSFVTFDTAGSVLGPTVN